jgi:uncharacterized membrane protein YwzB
MIAEIFGVDGLIILVVVVLFIGIPVWAIVDVAKQPSLSQGAKTGWIFGLILGTLILGPVGLVAALIYLFGVRPRVARAT